jgi:phenylpropionate dioxygenase-like ring-hydroxylating dioxygenase large terminal subunit
MLAEDIAIVESQRPAWIPLAEAGRETSLTPADQVSIAYRRILNELVAEHRRAAREATVRTI